MKEDVLNEIKEQNRKKNIVFISAMSFFFITLVSMFGILIWQLTKTDQEYQLLLADYDKYKLKASTNSYIILFNYYTQYSNLKLQKYSGYFKVTLANSSGVSFRVIGVDGFGIEEVIGSETTLGGYSLPSTVNFSSTKEISNILLQYSSTNSTEPMLTRIEIYLD